MTGTHVHIDRLVVDHPEADPQLLRAAVEGALAGRLPVSAPTVAAAVADAVARSGAAGAGGPVVRR